MLRSIDDHLPVRRRPLIFALIAATAFLLYFTLHSRTPHSSKALSQDAYLWQRAWTPEVAQAATRPSKFTSLCILAAELTWRDGHWDTKAINYDAAALRSSPASLAIAIRVTKLPPADSTPVARRAQAEQLRDACVSAIDRAHDAQLHPTELQLDIDCPESRLDTYVDWVRTIKARFGTFPIVITALPSWLDQPAFARLIAESGPYVLQVHGIDRPTSSNDLPKVCDTARAANWIEQAARLGVPFRVALPTYSYAVAFDANGKFLTLWAEGEVPALPAVAEVKTLSPNAADLAKLVADLTHNHPAALTGIIWFRLPVEVDQLNWQSATLDAVMSGHVPQLSLAVEQTQSPALRDLTLVNSGTADATDWIVHARWSGATLVASEALSGAKILASEPGEITFGPSDALSARLAAGGRMKLGWLRFDRDTEVACEVIPNPVPPPSAPSR